MLAIDHSQAGITQIVPNSVGCRWQSMPASSAAAATAAAPQHVPAGSQHPESQPVPSAEPLDGTCAQDSAAGRQPIAGFEAEHAALMAQVGTVQLCLLA